MTDSTASDQQPFQKLITEEDRQQLRIAVENLENPGLAARLASVVGTPIELLIKKLPESASDKLNGLTTATLNKVMNVALATMGKGDFEAANQTHKVAAAVSGAVGGASGLAGLAIELPITTTIIFRSIADIARAEGEDLSDPETCLACMQVFAFSGTGETDGSESGYFASRVALARAITEASQYLIRGVVAADAPLLVRFIMAVASRFGIVVTWKAAAQLVPVIGAIGGAAVNTIFMEHFQSVAQGHFTVRRLERTYGDAYIKELYEEELRRLRDPQKPAEKIHLKRSAVDVEHKVVNDEN